MRHPPFPALLASLSVAACTVGPSYVESSPAVAPGWISAANPHPIDEDWWRSLNDSQLVELVELAVTATTTFGRRKRAYAKRGRYATPHAVALVQMQHYPARPRRTASAKTVNCRLPMFRGSILNFPFSISDSMRRGKSTYGAEHGVASKRRTPVQRQYRKPGAMSSYR